MLTRSASIALAPPQKTNVTFKEGRAIDDKQLSLFGLCSSRTHQKVSCKISNGITKPTPYPCPIIKALDIPKLFAGSFLARGRVGGLRRLISYLLQNRQRLRQLFFFLFVFLEQRQTFLAKRQGKEAQKEGERQEQ
jgi:hypothetical protein